MKSEMEITNPLEWGERRMRGWDSTGYQLHSPSHGFIFNTVNLVLTKDIKRILGDLWTVTCSYGQDSSHLCIVGAYDIDEENKTQNSIQVYIANPAPLFALVASNDFPIQAYNEIRDLFIKFDLSYVPLELTQTPYDGMVSSLSDKHTWWDRYFGY